MTASPREGSPFGVIGVFFILLGAGVVLDGDWTRSGTCLMLLGAWCLWKAQLHARSCGPLS